MLLTDLWKDKCKEILLQIYHNNISEDSLDKFLEKYIKKSKSIKRSLLLRNVYQNQEFSIDLNEVINYVKQRNLNILANGAFTVSAKEKTADIVNYLIGELKGRKESKKLATKYQAEGKLELSKIYDTLQNKQKANINSTYGIMSMSGSFLNAIDSASAITGQARQLTAEMSWAFERFLAGNLQFTNYNEALLYYNTVLKKERNIEFIKKYIDYIPSRKIVQDKVLLQLTDLDNYNKETHSISKSLFWWFYNMSENDLIYLYYANNLKDLLEKNPKIMNYFRLILANNEEFLNPYSVPESYKIYLSELYSIINEFCIIKISTNNRMEKYGIPNSKYLGAPRKTIIISDTDSTFVTYNELKELIFNHCKNSLNLNHSLKTNEFKIINTLVYITSIYCEIMLDLFIKNTNTEKIFLSIPLSMKNEFYYDTIALFNGVKKNYVGWCLLREGLLVPEAKQMAYTGSKFTASNIPKRIKEKEMDIIENLILKTDTIDHIKILKEIKKLEDFIINDIKTGNKEFGQTIKFSGNDNYKSSEKTVETTDGGSLTINVISVEAYRLAELWNRLYPEDLILPGDKLQKFDTVIYYEGQLDLIPNIEIREKIRKCVYSEYYNGEYNILKRQGIKTIGIPKDGEIKKIPDWLLAIIDYNSVAKKQIQNLVDFLPSFGLNLSRINSTETNYSNLVSF